MMTRPFALFALFATALPASAQVSFKKEIAPILLRRCAGCHGERTNLGGWRAHTYAALTKRGSSGAAPLVPGKPETSELYKRLVAKSEAIRMPKSDDALDAAQLALFRKWILEGAKFDGPSPTTLLKNLLGPRTHPAAPVVYRTPVPVLALALLPGGKRVVVGGYHEVTIWDTTTGRLLQRLGGLPQRIQSLALTRDGKSLLVGGGTPGEYGEVTLVELSTGKRRVLDTFNDLVLSAVFSADETKLAAGGAEATVRTYARTSGERLWSMSVHSDWVTALGFSGDGTYLASASRDKTVKVYEAATGTLFTTFNGHNRQYGQFKGQDPVYALRFDGPLALSAGGGKWVQEWDPVKAKAESGDAGDMEDRFFKASHAQHLAHGFDREVFGLCLKEKQLFAVSGNGQVRQFDLTTQQPVRTYGDAGEWAFAVDADLSCQRLVVGGFDGQVRVFDTRSGQVVCRFAAQPGRGGMRTPPAVH